MTIYDSTVTPLPGNLPSQPFQAQQTAEFGDKVTFSGTARTLKDVTVTMSTWGCQTGNWNLGDCATNPGAKFSVPITLTIYGAPAGNAVGPMLAQVTQTFAIPYRPSADNTNCTGANAGKWFDGATCFNGKAVNITFDFNSSNVTLPNTVIYGIAFNTTNWGYSPVGPSACSATAAGCGYDSLNVALSSGATNGTDVDPNGVYWNTATFGPGYYCDGGAGGTNTFRYDAPCWGGLVPAVRFGASNPPASKDACKNGGWQTLTDNNGTPFKNQGDCV
ncbi:MAG: hypothetical protein QOG30_3169, partial [Acidimicrobiaceae bacterium]